MRWMHGRAQVLPKAWQGRAIGTTHLLAARPEGAKYEAARAARLVVAKPPSGYWTHRVLLWV